MNDSPRELSARLARLEREVARTRTIALGAVTALAATLFIGATALHPPAPLSPSALTVRDSAGHVRARLDTDGLHLYGASGVERILLGLNENNEPALHLNDATGTTRYTTFLSPTKGFATTRYLSSTSKSLATLAGEDDPYLGFYDSEHKWRVYLGVSSEHNPMLNLSNGSGHIATELLGGTAPRLSLYTGNDETIRETLGISSENNATLALYNAAGNSRAYLDGSDMPFFRLLTGTGIERLYFGLSKNGHALLNLNNHLGGEGYALTVNDGAYMKLFDGSAVERAYLGIYTDGSSGLTTYNPNHSTHWSSP